MAQVLDNLKLDPFDFVSGNEKLLLEGDSDGEGRKALDGLMRGFVENYLMAARDYAEWGAYDEAVALLDACKKSWPMLGYYRAWYLYLAGKNGTGSVSRGVREKGNGDAPQFAGEKENETVQQREEITIGDVGRCVGEKEIGDTLRCVGEKRTANALQSVEEQRSGNVFRGVEEKAIEDALRTAENCKTDYCFPNKLEDIAVLCFAIARGCRRKAYEEAEKLLRKAFIYPENLGEGKLEGMKDNHLYYHLGLALEGQERDEEARECFAKATLGTDEPAGALYYNDQPADMILYQGLAYRKLGREKEARARFYRLIDYGEQHLEDRMKIPYFAVSLPEFLIFDEDYTKRNRAHCCYLMALGNLGLGNREKAAGYLDEAVKIEPSHMMCRVYQKVLDGAMFL